MPTIYLARPDAVDDATGLIARYGAMAADEAASRANQSRNVGNVVHFCHWRQIARLIAVLAEPRAIGTIH